MARKYRVTKTRASVFPPTWWVREDLLWGPHVLGDETPEAAYERHVRRGFDTLADLEGYWRENRERLNAEYGAYAGTGWWG